ncbi:hypothetical protein BDR05DRAFT_947918 [Suillus weaverae]|nr:hypothetical protein BDR05DRAFT_947918 [Suillus weaverae]
MNGEKTTTRMQADGPDFCRTYADGGPLVIVIVGIDRSRYDQFSFEHDEINALNPTGQYLDFGRGYQEDGDVVSQGRSEVDFGLHSSDEAAASSLDLELEDAVQYLMGQTETPCWAMDQASYRSVRPLVILNDIPTVELDLGLHSPNIELPDGDLVLDDVSEFDWGLHPSGAAAASSLDLELEDAVQYLMGQTETPCWAMDQASYRSVRSLVILNDIPTVELDLGLHSPNIELPDGDLVLDDVSEFDWGLRPSGAAAASSLDLESEDAGDGSELDLGLHPSDAAAMGFADAEATLAGPSSAIGAEPSGGSPPMGGLAPYAPTKYRHLPCWVSQDSSLTAVNEFNAEYRRRETQRFGELQPELLSLPGAPTDNPIPPAADLHEILLSDTGQARYSPTADMETGTTSAASGSAQLPSETSSIREDLDIPLSEEELLKISRSILTLSRFNGVASTGSSIKVCLVLTLLSSAGYARRLVNDVSDGDEERVQPTLQEILEAERPFHVAYLATTDNFRKTLHDLQRAVRLHDQTLQLQAQLDVMIAAVEGQEQVFK